MKAEWTSWNGMNPVTHTSFNPFIIHCLSFSELNECDFMNRFTPFAASIQLHSIKLHLISWIEWLAARLVTHSLIIHSFMSPCFIHSRFVSLNVHEYHSFIDSLTHQFTFVFVSSIHSWRQNYRRYFNPAPHPLCPTRFTRTC